MDVALIAPVSLLKYAETQGAQMMLPSIRDPGYLYYYRRLAGHGDYWVMLDNGAWEKDTLTIGDLLGIGWRFQVQEIVAPDIINNSAGTKRFMERFHKKYELFKKASVGWNPNFVGVAHGQSIQEAMDFVKMIVDEMPWVTTISAGRAFTRACGNNKARAVLASWVQETFPNRFWFHLLGYNDAWHGELAACQETVRSVDTVAPFTAAYYGLKFNDVTEKNAPRPAGYFNVPARRFDIPLVEDNIKRLLGAARGS